jgi:hypothetical protein
MKVAMKYMATLPQRLFETAVDFVDEHGGVVIHEEHDGAVRAAPSSDCGMVVVAPRPCASPHPWRSHTPAS